MKHNKQRKAFSMLTAIVVIILMASVGAFVMSLSGKMVKTTTTQFQREQAMLLAKSYTEYAIMAVMSNDRTTNCLGNITGNALGYNITVNISYIGRNIVADPSGVPNTCSNILSNIVVTPESTLNIIVDVYVRYNDLDNPAGAPITYHKRTLQKI